MFLIWIGLSVAGAPDRVATALDVGTSSTDAVRIVEDAGLVGFVTGSQARVLDLDDWSVHDVGTCSAAGMAFGHVDAKLGVDLYVACKDGTLKGYAWDDGDIASLEVDDAPLSVAVQEEPLAVFWDEERGSVFVVGQADADVVLSVVEVDPARASAQTGVLLPRDGFVDAVVDTGRILYVAHGGDEMSQISLGSSTAGLVTSSLSVSIKDLARRYGGGVVALDSRGHVLEHTPSGVGYTYLLQNGPDDTDAIGLYPDAEAGWLLLAGSQASVYGMTGALLDGIEVDDSFDLSWSVVDIATSALGWHFAAASGGNLLVITDKPWVSDVTATPSSAVDGETVTVAFAADVDGEAQVYLGGDHTDPQDLVGTSNVTAGVGASVELTVDSGWIEGDNRIYVVVTDSRGNSGHARVSVVVDNPPSKPIIDENSLSFANSALVLAFDGISDADLDHYDVYVTVTPFEPSDWASGGPEFDGNDALDAPIEVSSSGGERVTQRIEPLSNGVTYYIAVRATDAGGVEGPMSDVVSGSPRPTYSASEMVGDPGGSTCATVPGTGWLVVALGGLVLGMRRRRAAVSLVALVGLGVASGARAADNRGDITDAWGNFELRMGAVNYADPILDEVYGGGRIIQIEAGPQLFRFVELDVGFGFMQDLSFKIDEYGDRSAERTMITWYPLSASATLRGHFWDEQPVVPFGRLGLDWVFWDEKWDSGGGKALRKGIKHGWHIGVGGSLLLDTFAPGRASLLESQTGINDTSIVFEYRVQKVHPAYDDGSPALSFDAREFTVGIKLDF